MKLSMARSLATAMVNPNGCKLACATQEANIALLTSPFLAVTMYNPLLIRPNAFSMLTSRVLSCLMLRCRVNN